MSIQQRDDPDYTTIEIQDCDIKKSSKIGCNKKDDIIQAISNLKGYHLKLENINSLCQACWKGVEIGLQSNIRLSELSLKNDESKDQTQIYSFIESSLNGIQQSKNIRELNLIFDTLEGDSIKKIKDYLQNTLSLEKLKISISSPTLIVIVIYTQESSQNLLYLNKFLKKTNLQREQNPDSKTIQSIINSFQYSKSVESITIKLMYFDIKDIEFMSFLQNNSTVKSLEISLQGTKLNGIKIIESISKGFLKNKSIQTLNLNLWQQQL